jgi:hypothetical protein
MKYIIGFLFMLFGSTLYAQGIQTSIIVETFATIPDQTYQSDYPLFPMSVYFNVKTPICERYKLELRPGFLAIKDYAGWEFGAFVSRDLSDTYFASAGLNLHFNISESHGAGNYTEVDSGPYLSAGLTAGANLSRTFSFLVSMYKPFMKQYGYYYFYTFDQNGSHHNTTVYKIDVMLKAGIEINL